jgi:ribosomal protein L16 Arg81 hydroxylase
VVADGHTLRRTSGLPGLLDRVVHLRRRRSSDVDAADAESPAADSPAELSRQIAALDERIQYLETMIEGLQDSVYRDSVRHERQINELEEKTEPGEINRALNREARERGI